MHKTHAHKHIHTHVHRDTDTVIIGVTYMYQHNKHCTMTTLNRPIRLLKTRLINAIQTVRVFRRLINIFAGCDNFFWCNFNDDIKSIIIAIRVCEYT